MSEKNVYQRLAEVRKSISYLKKEKSGSQFQYVGSSDVLGALQKAKALLIECFLFLGG